MDTFRVKGYLSMWITWFFCFVGITAIVVVVERAQLARQRALVDRPCKGIYWHRQFPNESHDTIREFLHLFADAFSIERMHATKFAPDDRLRAIYEAKWLPHLTLDDDLEFETLEEFLNSKYQVRLRSVWHENLTLGELFSLTKRST